MEDYYLEVGNKEFELDMIAFGGKGGKGGIFSIQLYIIKIALYTL